MTEPRELLVHREVMTARHALTQAEFDVLPRCELEVFHDRVVGRLHAALRGYYARSAQEIETRVPADWWQAVRERWAPAWWLARYPVRTRAIASSYVRLCPHVELPGHAPEHVFWMADLPLGTWE